MIYECYLVKIGSPLNTAKVVELIIEPQVNDLIALGDNEAFEVNSRCLYPTNTGRIVLFGSFREFK